MIERKVADTILESKKKVELGGVIYEVAPPSMNTLYELSAMVSGLPMIDVDKEDVITLVIRHAKDCRILNDIVALLIVGYRGMKKRKLFGKNPFEQVRERIGNERPRLVEGVLSGILKDSDIESFFRITTFLREVNLLNPTEKVGAPGQ